MIWTDSEYRALAAAAGQIVARPLDLLVVLASESGLRPNAVAIVKGEPYALGLNQITPPNAKGMGIYPSPWDSIPSMGVSEQMQYVVGSFRAAAGKRVYHDAGHLYQANFAPASLARGTADSLVLYSEPSAGYLGNKGLDRDNNGTITVGDLRKRLRDVAIQPWFREHVHRMRALGLVSSGAEPKISGPLSWVPWAVGGGALASMIGLYLWGRRSGLDVRRMAMRSLGK